MIGTVIIYKDRAFVFNSQDFEDALHRFLVYGTGMRLVRRERRRIEPELNTVGRHAADVATGWRTSRVEADCGKAHWIFRIDPGAVAVHEKTNTSYVWTSGDMT